MADLNTCQDGPKFAASSFMYYGSSPPQPNYVLAAKSLGTNLCTALTTCLQSGTATCDYMFEVSGAWYGIQLNPNTVAGQVWYFRASDGSFSTVPIPHGDIYSKFDIFNRDPLDHRAAINHGLGFPATTVDACVAWCNQLQGCSAFSYYTNGLKLGGEYLNECYPKGGDALNGKSDVSNYRSGFSGGVVPSVGSVDRVLFLNNPNAGPPVAKAAISHPAPNPDPKSQATTSASSSAPDPATTSTTLSSTSPFTTDSLVLSSSYSNAANPTTIGAVAAPGGSNSGGNNGGGARPVRVPTGTEAANSQTRGGNGPLTPNNGDPDGSSNGRSGMLIGVAVGVILLFLITAAGFAIYIFYRRRRTGEQIMAGFDSKKSDNAAYTIFRSNQSAFGAVELTPGDDPFTTLSSQRPGSSETPTADVAGGDITSARSMSSASTNAVSNSWPVSSPTEQNPPIPKSILRPTIPKVRTTQQSLAQPMLYVSPSSASATSLTAQSPPASSNADGTALPDYQRPVPGALGEAIARRGEEFDAKFPTTGWT